MTTRWTDVYLEGEMSSAGPLLPSVEIEEMVAERFSRAAYCLVEHWLTCHVGGPPESLA